MDRKEQAVMLHKNGFNCAQAVACSFCHVMGADPITTFRLAEPLGYGMGQMGTCGAVSAMALVTGMKMSDGNLDQPGTKKECYQMMSELTAAFKEKVGSIVCREIKGEDTGTPLLSCDDCIAEAAALLDKYLLGIE